MPTCNVCNDRKWVPNPVLELEDYHAIMEVCCPNCNQDFARLLNAYLAKHSRAELDDLIDVSSLMFPNRSVDRWIAGKSLPGSPAYKQYVVARIEKALEEGW